MLLLFTCTSLIIKVLCCAVLYCAQYYAALCYTALYYIVWCLVSHGEEWDIVVRCDIV